MPTWIVVGAGTGGTSATIGRYVRYRRHPTKLCVVDPENSAFYPGVARPRTGRCRHLRGSRIEGIGRPARGAVVPAGGGGPDDPGAGRRLAGRHAGRLEPSWAAGSAARPAPTCGERSRLIAEMRAAGETGSVVTLLCDSGERYAHTYFADDWVRAQGLDLAPYLATIDTFLATGAWRPPA